MKIGMLWFDNDPKADLKVKIERAASYYSKKYGQSPNLCFIHPSMAPAPNGNGNGSAAGRSLPIEIRTNRSVLPNHFWIGIADTPVS
jgi:hypothetical protein